MTKKNILFIAGLILLSGCGTSDNSTEPSEEFNVSVSDEVFENNAQQEEINPEDYTRFTRTTLDLMDTVTDFISFNRNEEEFEQFFTIVYDEMIRLHQIFNTFDAFEGVNNLHTVNEMAGIEPVEVDPLVIDLINRSLEAYEWSNGAVNIALGPVIELWHNARYGDDFVLPTTEELEYANQFTNIHDIVIDEDNNTLFLPHKGMALDVGALAKGMTVELATQAAVDAGFDHFLISAGGDIQMVGSNLNNDAGTWASGITNPEDPNGNSFIDIIRVPAGSVVTSGDYQRFFYVDGVRYHHIIDPVTLFPATHYRSLTIIHDSATMADTLATALFILPLEEAKEIAHKMGAEALWVLTDGTLAFTDGYPRFSDTF